MMCPMQVDLGVSEYDVKIVIWLVIFLLILGFTSLSLSN